MPVGADLEEIKYELMREEHVPQIQQLLLRSFFVEEPLGKFVKLKVPEEVEEFVTTCTPRFLKGDISFVAVDANNNDEVIGVRLAAIEKRGDGDSVNQLLAGVPFTERVEKIFNFLGHVNEGVDVFGLYNVDTVLRMKILNVDPRYGGRGIARRLVLETMRHAKEVHGAGAMSAEATGCYSQRLYQKMQCDVQKEVLYDEYKVDGKVVFNRNGSIHEKTVVFTKRL